MNSHPKLQSDNPLHVNPRQISVAEFDAWLGSARSGGRIVYVHGDALPRLCPVAAAVRHAVTAGLVVSVTDRRSRPAKYLAERTSKALPAPVAARLGQKLTTRDAQDAEALLAELERVSERGARVAPSLPALSGLIGLPIHRIRTALAGLRMRGLLTDNLFASPSGGLCRQFVLA